MKNTFITKTILLIIATVLFTGCEKELLEQSNPNAITTDSFWKTRDDFDKATNALYSSLQFPSVSGGELINNMLRSDEGGTESWYGTPLSYTNLTWTDASTFVQSRWSELYIGIYRANQVLYFASKADFLSDEEKKLILAQARFLRGLNYFWLATTYNGAVIHDELAQDNEQFHRPFSPASEVYSKVVIPDLQIAYKDLPKVWTGKNTTGRFTWGAAASMLGKVYLYQKDWTNAAKYFKEVIDAADNDGLYRLTSVYMDNFTSENEFNSESILEVAFSDNYKQGANGSAVDNVLGSAGSEAQSLASAFASIIGAGGYNTVLPTYWMQELFVAGDSLDVSIPANVGRRYSSRTFASIVVEFGDGDYYKAPLTTNLVTGQKSKANFAYGQGSKVKKWTQWYKVESEDPATGARSGINFRHIRLADIYLMYAEAVLEGSGDVNTAKTYIDKVRKRAGVLTLQQYQDANNGQIPVLDKPRFPNSLKTHDLTPLNKTSLLRHLRMVERPLELSFEGHRWNDLVRWGIIKDVFTQRYEEEKLITKKLINPATGGISGPKIFPLYLNERVRPDWVVPAATYQSATHDYFPIPAIEKQSNKALR